MASGNQIAGRGVALWLTLVLLLIPESAAPITLAGSVIRHGFTASFTVEAHRQIPSNQTEITIKDLADPSLVPARNASTQAGKAVNLLHTITNRGNSADSFLLKASLLQPVVSDTSSPFEIRFLAGDGVTPLPVDASGNQSTAVIAPGASVDLVLQVTPSSTSAGRVANITVTATSALIPARSVNLTDQLVVLAQDPPQVPPQLKVTKIAGADVAEAGDIVSFSVRVENIGGAVLQHTTVNDLLPRGFRYLKGSTLLDGSSYADPTGAGQQLSWDLGRLEAGKQRTLSYRCVVSADAPVGSAVNRVTGTGTTSAGSSSVSPTALATVRVRPSPLSDRAIILGRLFEDLNGNGIPDPGEPGVPGVRVYLEDGSFSFSDAEGQYSFTGISAGNHVVKIDRSTLARRLKPVPFNTAFAGVGWSQFITAPFGGPARGDFALVDSGLTEEPRLGKEQARPSLGQNPAQSPQNPDSEELSPVPPQAQSRVQSLVHPFVEQQTLPLGETQPAQLSFQIPPGPARPAKGTGSGSVARLTVSPTRVDMPADGASVLPVTVELLNAQGERITGDGMVTVTLLRGTIVEPDRDPVLDGHQVRIRDGVGVFRIRAPKQGGQDLVLVLGENATSAKVDLYFSSQLRDWIVVGLGNLDVGARTVSGNLEKIDKEDRFDEGLFHEERLAFFARGKILGKYLLTAAYDSDKERREGVFQYIDPEKYYPVYGDASDLGYEAQSRGKIYLKLEAERSYLLAGDYRTDLSENEFSRYDRALNGVKVELDREHVSAKGFESRTEETVTRDQIAANGTSGYYMLSRTPVFENSERVRIEVRDRYHSERVLSVVQKLRYADYSIDYSSGAILFKEPIPSLDQNLNPVTIVVNYQSQLAGAERYVYGGRTVVKADNGSYLGGSAVVEEGSVQNDTLLGLDGNLQLGDRASLKGEGAVSDTLERGRGSAWKLNLNGRPLDTLEVGGYYRKVEADFFNPSMTGNETGTEKYGGRLDYRGINDTLLFAESFVQKETLQGNRLFGNQAGVVKKFSLWEGEGGFKRVEQEQGVLEDASNLFYAGIKGPLTPRLEATLRRDQLLGSSQVAEYQSRTFLKLDYRITDATRAFVTEEYQEGHPLLRQATRFGLESKLNDRMRLTTGYQLSSGYTGSTEQSSVDLNTKLMEREGFTLNSRSGYQLEHALSGSRGQAILGLNTKLTAAPGLLLNASLERVETVQGASGTRTAFTLAAEYLRRQDLKLTGRYEIRTGPGETAALYGAGVAYKVNGGLTLLGKASLWDRDLDASHDLLQDSYLGSSWRPLAGNPLQLLTLVRYKEERRGSAPDSDRSRSVIVSAEPSYRVVRDWTLQGKYAAKQSWLEDAAGRSYEALSDLVLAGISYDLAKRWELSCYLKLLNQYDTGQLGLGGVARVGYRVYRNVVLSAGYNYARLDDRDLTGETFQGQGPFVGVKVKFDEDMFEFERRSQSAAPKPPVAAVAEPPAPPKAPVPALLVAAWREDEPLRLSGSAELFTLLINGQHARLPSTGVTVNREPLAGSLAVKSGRLTRTLEFLTSIERPDLVRSWSLAIVNEAGEPVATLTGKGAPKPRIGWDGATGPGGTPLAPGGVYQYRLEVTYRDGSRFGTSPEMFGVSRQDIVLLTLSGGAFVFDSSELTPQAKRLLRQAAQALRLHPEEKVVLEGHTDWVGSVNYNLGLSKRRCDAAADFLVREEAIAANRLVRRWYGKSRPIADNRSDEGRERNRRVELKADFQRSIAAARKDRFRGTPFLVVNDATVPVDPLGRFETSVPAESGRLTVQMGDSTGRFMATEIAVPQLTLTEPAGEKLVTFGSVAGGVRVAADGAGHCRVAGKCDPGTSLELDGKVVQLDGDGRFAVDLPLSGADQTAGMVLRGEGWARLMNLKLRSTPQHLRRDQP